MRFRGNPIPAIANHPLVREIDQVVEGDPLYCP